MKLDNEIKAMYLVLLDVLNLDEEMGEHSDLTEQDYEDISAWAEDLRTGRPFDTDGVIAWDENRSHNPLQKYKDTIDKICDENNVEVIQNYGSGDYPQWIHDNICEVKIGRNGNHGGWNVWVSCTDQNNYEEISLDFALYPSKDDIQKAVEKELQKIKEQEDA